LSEALAFLEGKDLPSPSSVFAQADKLLYPTRQTSSPENWKHWTCDICQDRETGAKKVIVGSEAEFQMHLTSRGHKAKLRSIKNKQKWDNWKAEQELKRLSGKGLDTRELSE